MARGGARIWLWMVTLLEPADWKLRPTLLLTGTVARVRHAKEKVRRSRLTRAGHSVELRLVSGWLLSPGWVSWKRHWSGAGGVAVGVGGSWRACRSVWLSG